jgi:hypothetical protein
MMAYRMVHCIAGRPFGRPFEPSRADTCRRVAGREGVRWNGAYWSGAEDVRGPLRAARRLGWNMGAESAAAAAVAVAVAALAASRPHGQLDSIVTRQRRNTAQTRGPPSSHRTMTVVLENPHV